MAAQDDIDAHAALIDRVALAWNDLHSVVGKLFEEFSRLRSSEAEILGNAIGCYPTQSSICRWHGRAEIDARTSAAV